MGTRHLIAAQIDGDYRIAQYGQWDGYPSGQGVDVLAFLRTMDRSSFEAKLRASRLMTKAEWPAWAEYANAHGGGEGGLSVPAWTKTHPHMARGCGADILTIVANSDGLTLRNNLTFACDSLFCEYGYVVDFDKGTFEVFKGFNREPLPEGERFYGLDPGDENPAEGYWPIRLVKSYPLDCLPSDAQFLADLERDEDD